MRFLLAYIDPAAGATLMQLAIAGTVGVGALIKLKWQSIKSIKSILSTSNDSDPVDADPRSLSDKEITP